MEHSLKLFDDHSDLEFSIESTHEEKILDLELEQDIYTLESYINILTDAEKSVEMLTTIENMSLCDNVTDESLALSFEASLGLVGLKEKTKNINKENVKKKAGEYKDKIKNKGKAIYKAIVNFISRVTNGIENKLVKLRIAYRNINFKKSLEKLKEDEGTMRSYIRGGSINDVLKTIESLGNLENKDINVRTGFHDHKIIKNFGTETKVYNEIKKVKFSELTRKDLSHYLDVGTRKFYKYPRMVKELTTRLADLPNSGTNEVRVVDAHKMVLKDLAEMVDISLTLAKKLDYSKAGNRIDLK